MVKLVSNQSEVILWPDYFKKVAGKSPLESTRAVAYFFDERTADPLNSQIDSNIDPKMIGNQHIS